MTDDIDCEGAKVLSDDSRAYAQAQADFPVYDPLAAIKALRLEQLAVCRLKSEKEMQTMLDELENNQNGMSD